MFRTLIRALFPAKPPSPDPAIQPLTELQAKRRELADRLEGRRLTDQIAILEEVYETDPELYISWRQSPL